MKEYLGICFIVGMIMLFGAALGSEHAAKGIKKAITAKRLIIINDASYRCSMVKDLKEK